MLDVHATEIEVVVTRVVSSLDTGAIHGRGTGVLRDDRGVQVTFLLGQAEFQDLRQRMLGGGGDVRCTVRMGDVTAIDSRCGQAAALAT